MTVEKLIDILKKNNVSPNANIMSDSGWECNATDVNGVYYSDEVNTVVLTQGFEENYESNDFKDYAEFKTLYNKGM